MGLPCPCKNCPFLRGSTFEMSMARERAQEIADSIMPGNGHFPCHKTTVAGGAERGHETWCAGALATMENEGTVMQNQMVRISGRLGEIEDPAKLDGLGDCYDTLDEWVATHHPLHRGKI